MYKQSVSQKTFPSRFKKEYPDKLLLW